MNKLTIYYEDQDVIVCYKEAGIATQTARLGEQDMESRLKNYLAAEGQKPWIGVVHRLDQPVEGVMVFAKNPQAAASLSEQVKQRSIGKRYYAITVSAPDEPEGTLVDYLCFNHKDNRTVIAESKTAGSKRAELSYRVLKQAYPKALLDIDLKTGRHHQIRVQLAHIGCPLVGDKKYGKLDPAGPLGLCAYRLDFEHPVTGEPLSFQIRPRGAAFEEFSEFSDNGFS